MTFVSGDILYQSIAKIAAAYNAMGAISVAAYDFENRFSVADAASVVENTNLSISRIDAILNNVNLSDSKASQIIYETDVATRDLSACSNVIGTAEIVDDWQDNKLTSRDSEDTTPISIGPPFVQDANTFRPEWTTVTGTPSLSSGILTISDLGDADYKNITAVSTFTVDAWEFRVSYSGGSDGSILSCIPMYVDTDNYYLLQLRRDVDVSSSLPTFLNKIVTGSSTTIINITDAGVDTTYSTWKITRDSSGNFEVLKDGASKGTVTDTDITTSANIALGQRDSDAMTCNWDWMKVY